MTIAEDLLTPDELAKHLHVTRRTIERWHAERSGPPRITLGRKIYYRIGAVRQWVLDQEQEQPRAQASRRAGGRA